jgi:hypothetical protein
MAPKKAKKTADSINSRLALGTFDISLVANLLSVMNPQYVADSCGLHSDEVWQS